MGSGGGASQQLPPPSQPQQQLQQQQQALSQQAPQQRQPSVRHEVWQGTLLLDPRLSPGWDLSVGVDPVPLFNIVAESSNQIIAQVFCAVPCRVML